jgi:hypothetical protein
MHSVHIHPLHKEKFDDSSNDDFCCVFERNGLGFLYGGSTGGHDYAVGQW